MRCSALTLKDAVRRLAQCTGKPAGRYRLDVVQFEPEQDAVTLVATNCIVAGAIKIGASEPRATTFRVGIEDLEQAVKTLRRGEVEVAVSGDEVQFRSNGVASQIPLVTEGKFPDWRSVLPFDRVRHPIECSAAEMRRALERLPKAKGKRNGDLILQLEMLEGKLKMTSFFENEQDQKFVEEVNATYHGRRSSVWMKLKLWRKLFRTAAPKETVCEISVFQRAGPIVRCGFATLNCLYWIACLAKE